jgi:hypothetical protein
MSAQWSTMGSAMWATVTNSDALPLLVLVVLIAIICVVVDWFCTLVDPPRRKMRAADARRIAREQRQLLREDELELRNLFPQPGPEQQARKR